MESETGNPTRSPFRHPGEIQEIDSKTARWIASDALRELTNENVQKRLEKT